MGHIDRVLLSTTPDPLYSEASGYVAQAWANMGIKVTLTMVTHIEGIPIQNVGKLMRVLSAFDYPDDYCLISDVDMLPLNKYYFIDNSKHVTDSNIVFYTSELEGEDKGKFPICYMLAKGSTFKRLLNPESKSIEGLIRSWNFGPMENTKGLPFSDESLYRRLFKDAEKVCLTRHHQHRRLCRSNWNLDQSKLDSHWYIDCHLLRPFEVHREQLRPVFSSIGIEI